MCAFAAYTNLPDGMEPGLEGVTYYDPPNMTYPFGTYMVVVDIDKGTGEVKVRRMVAVDDCGVRINPMIVEGQIHGGLCEGYGIAFTELITFDEDGNCIGSNFMDYLLPTSWETPNSRSTRRSRRRRIIRWAPRAWANPPPSDRPPRTSTPWWMRMAHLGVRNIEMPVTSDKVWAALRGAGVIE